MAEATGVQRGSLYNAYGDKERLFLLAFERYASRFLDFVRQALSNPDPAVALTALFKGAIANMTEGAPSRGCLTTKTAIELPLAGKAIEARVKRLIEDFTALIRDGAFDAGRAAKAQLRSRHCRGPCGHLHAGTGGDGARLSESPAPGKNVAAIRAHPVAGSQAPPQPLIPRRAKPGSGLPGRHCLRLVPINLSRVNQVTFPALSRRLA